MIKYKSPVNAELLNGYVYHTQSTKIQTPGGQIQHHDFMLYSMQGPLIAALFQSTPQAYPHHLPQVREIMQSIRKIPFFKEEKPVPVTNVTGEHSFSTNKHYV